MAILTELPDSLVSEILVRLPVKSLMQCICVCKSWYNLVSDPFFIRSHLSQKSADEKEYLATGFVSDPDMEEYYSFRCDETFLEKLKAKFPISKSTWSFKIAGCCNGLLLMLNLHPYGSSIYLWNPSLGKIKPLPSAHATYENEFRLEAVGLAFLPEDYDYKVIRILNFLSDGFSVADIYSLKTDSWRRIETPVMQFMHNFIHPLPAAFVNPFLYWIGLKNHDRNCTDFIVSFNVKSQTFKATSSPLACFDHKWVGGSLAVYQGSLYLFAFNIIIENWSLWKMNENCSSEMEWLKVCTFQYWDWLPLGFMKNGDVIVEDMKSNVSLHDPRNVSSPRNIKCEIRRGIRSSEVYNYSPSLALYCNVDMRQKVTGNVTHPLCL